MRRRNPLLILLALLMTISLAPGRTVPAFGAEPTWTLLGLDQYGVDALAINPTTPTTLVAGTPSGVFRSTNGGASWSQASTGMVSGPVEALAFNPLNPSILFAGTTNDLLGHLGGVFRSTNGGDSWSGLDLGVPAGTILNVHSLAISPTDPQIVFAGTDTGLYRTLDGGASWSSITVGTSAQGVITFVSFDPVTPGRVYTSLDGIHRSDDNGTTWVPLGNAPTGSSLLAISPTDPTTIYLTAMRNPPDPELGVYRSTNGGATFQIADSGLGNLHVTSLLADPRDPLTVYAGTLFGGAGSCTGGVYRSSDGGGSWSRFGQIGASCAALNISGIAFAPGDPDILYATSGNGLYRSSLAPTISSQPLNQRIRPGTAVTLDVTAGSGTAPFSYQWYEGVSGDTSRPIAGATARTFTTPALSANTAYWVRLSNSVGSVDSTTATISIKGAYDPILDGFNSSGSFHNFGYTPGDAIPGASWEIFKRTFPANSMELPDGRPRKGARIYFLSPTYREAGKGGNCFGMAAVSMLRYLDSHDTTEQLTLNPYYRRFTQVGDLPPVISGDVHVGQSSVKDYIFLYQGRQQSVQIQGALSRQKSITPAQTFDAIRQITQAGNVALLLFSVPGAGHAVVAYSTQQVGNAGTISIYDPNWPGDTTRQLSVDLGTNQWSYELWPGTTWSGSADLKYLPVSFLFPAFVDVSEKDAATPVANESGITLGVEGNADLLITDSQGHQFGPNALDPTQEISGALRLVNFSFNPDQPNATSPEAYYLPAGQTYTVTVQPAAGLQATLAAATESYTLTAFGAGSAMTLGGASLSGGQSDSLVIQGTPRTTTFTPATDGDYCQALTDEVSAENSRQYDACITGGDGVPATIAIGANGTFTVTNAGAKAINTTVTTTQVGSLTGDGTTATTLAPGGQVAAPPPLTHTYLPLIRR